MRSFYARKLHAQVFCAEVLGLYFTGAKLLGQKLHVELWPFLKPGNPDGKCKGELVLLNILTEKLAPEKIGVKLNILWRTGSTKIYPGH